MNINIFNYLNNNSVYNNVEKNILIINHIIVLKIVRINMLVNNKDIIVIYNVSIILKI